MVSMHLLVLSAFRRTERESIVGASRMSQCTFWCSVLSDMRKGSPLVGLFPVSMHLLVLSAFRRD